MHCPWEEQEGLVHLNSFYRPPGHCLWLERRKKTWEPDSHALEHLCAGVEGQDCGGIHSRTVQQPQGQALHESKG